MLCHFFSLDSIMGCVIYIIEFKIYFSVIICKKENKFVVFQNQSLNKIVSCKLLVLI